MVSPVLLGALCALWNGQLRLWPVLAEVAVLALRDVIQAIGAGKDAQGQVKVMLELNNEDFVGKGTSTDILEASGLAYLNAINRHFFRNKTIPNGTENEVKDDK